MMYLNPIQNENGSYPNLQSTYAAGLVAFPDEFMSEFFKEGKDCAGFVDITHDNKTVLTCVWNEDNYQAYLSTLPEEKEPTPSELREQVYNTEAIIEWNNEMITVTQASQLWQYYATEGSEKASELTALVAAAKQEIRSKYPD